MEMTTESNSGKKKITLSDVKVFFENILYFLRFGNEIYGSLFYKNLIYNLIGRTITFSNSLFYGFFIDGIIKGYSSQYLYGILTGFILIQFLNETVIKFYEEKLEIQEELLVEKYDRLEMSKYSEVPVGDRLKDEFKDTSKRVNTGYIIQFFKNLEELILAVYTIFIASFALTLIDYRIIILTVVGVFIGFKFRIESEKKLSEKRGIINAYNNYRYSLLDAFKSSKISNIDDNIAISNNSKLLLKKLDDYYSMYKKFRYDLYYNLEKNKRIAGYIFALVMSVSYFVIYSYGIQKAVEVGILIIVFTTYERLFYAINNILRLSSNFTKNYLDMIYVKKFFEYTYEQKSFKEIDDEKKLEIEFKNVYFKYPSSKDYVLKNINFKISKGDILAIIGNNGAGKSTLMKLLFKIFEPTKGEIFINGINIQKIKDQDYLKLFHILPQEFMVEDTLTVEELIYLGNSEKRINTKNVIWAAKNSTAHNFIMDLKNGYKQKIFTLDWIDWVNRNLKLDMVDLSAGQIRKIQIARLFYSEKPIIFMDEATSNVDAESTAKIFENLKHLKNNQILGFITHNLLNISLANKILILKEGQIVEFDSKENLIKKKDSELNKQLKLLKLQD